MTAVPHDQQVGLLRRIQQCPKWAYLLTGIVSTVVLLIAGIFIKNQNNLYYAVFAAPSVTFLLPYLLMFPAVTRLRMIDADRERPFRVPGGLVGLWTCVVLATAASLVLFLWMPGAATDWSYTGPLVGIAAGAVVVGEVIVAWCMRRLRSAPPAVEPFEPSEPGGPEQPTRAA